jgi:WD40 repeat protein
MSTTTDEAVALTFAKEGDARTASTLVVASMGMIDRGATLDWLSQYPHEREILLPPLTAMEVVDIEDFVDSGAFQIRKLHVRLNTNMVSMTIENLLSVRKKQVSELAEIVARDMSNHDMAADIGKRTRKLRATQAKVQLQPSEAFNTNQAFLSKIDQVKSLMPQTGDCIQELYGHSRDVYGLVATESGFASSSWDGTLRVWTLGDDSTYTNTTELQLPSASLSLVAAGVDWVASSQFDGVVSMHSLSITETDTAGIVEHRATAALESRLAAFRHGEEVCIEGAEELTAARRSSAATKKLTHEGSSTAVVSLAVLSTASSPLRPDDVTVSVDEVSSLVPAASTTVWLACGSMDGSISLWEVHAGETSKLVQSVGGRSQAGHGHGHGDGGHSGTVRALVWAHLGEDNVLVSGSFDCTIIVWRLTSNGRLEQIKNLGSEEGTHEGAVTALACIDAGGARIASAGENGTIKLWDLSSPAQATRTIELHGKGVCSLAWLANPANTGHDWLACGMGDNIIILCDLETGREVTTMHGHSGAVHALLWLESKGWLVSGSSDATVRTWRVRSGSG